ncbi:DUF4312 family protein [Listeria rustica]|uniref:DUF4312 family protein n=1 Tax=Listeria rustica TaxID=2713503 RepID=A0A7W1YGV2_9LIST|nr:DUF4312 family protein [Listeria rustica]MBA3927077.1 DUF4312 family protein [Listeria rustica]
MQENMKETVQITGKGKTKQHAINAALGQVQKQVMAKYPNTMILRIEPRDVSILTATEKRYKETFMFFLFPRIRQEFEVKLEIALDLAVMHIEKVNFTVEDNTKNKLMKKLAKG